MGFAPPFYSNAVELQDHLTTWSFMHTLVNAAVD